ncbi:MAG: DUF4238 domain-containing protein [Usitatibacter sp.]
MSKHHFVPEFLLRHWHSGPDNRLSRIGRERDAIVHKRRSAKMCARHRDVYRLRGTTDPEALESIFLGEVDNDAARVHCHLIAMGRSHEYSPDERIAWSRFVVALMRRHPTYIRYLLRRGAEEYEKAVEAFKADHGGTLSAEFEEWLAGPGAINKQNIGLTNVFTQLVNSELVNNAVLKAHWKVRRLDGAKFDLLIGDRPVIYGGALNATFLLTLPLTPHHVFFAFNDPETGRRIDATPPTQVVKIANLDTVTFAYTHVFATSDEQLRFVSNHLKPKPIPPITSRPMLDRSP